MHLDSIAPVLEIKISPDRLGWKLAGLPYRNESEAHSIGDGRAKDEATCFDTDYEIDTRVFVAIRDLVDGEAEACGVDQKGRDIAELDAGLRMVGDGSNEGFEVRHLAPVKVVKVKVRSENPVVPNALRGIGPARDSAKPV